MPTILDSLKKPRNDVAVFVKFSVEVMLHF